MQCRSGGKADAADLAGVFFRAVRNGPSPYSEAQRAAWVPSRPEATAFERRIAPLDIFVLESQGEVSGFMATDKRGYIDLVFILSEARGRGGFRLLYEATELKSRSNGLKRLWTHASLPAQPAFRAMGFSVIQHETVERAGQLLRRAVMEKSLT
ncbi:MAG: GNAT family N-acetyltransferase [Pseudomonadota bacterium]